MIGMNTLLNLKKNGMTILTQSLKGVKKVFGSINKDKPTYITGTHYMYLQWSKIDVGQPDFRESNRLFYLFWEGLQGRYNGVMECVILKTDDQVSLSWHQARLLIRQQYPPIQDLAYYQSLGQMQRKCLLIRSYPYQLITPSFSNQSKTVWTGRKRNLRTEYQRPNLPVKNLTTMRNSRRSQVSTQRSTGRTRGTTRTMVKN